MWTNKQINTIICQKLFIVPRVWSSKMLCIYLCVWCYKDENSYMYNNLNRPAGKNSFHNVQCGLTLMMHSCQANRSQHSSLFKYSFVCLFVCKTTTGLIWRSRWAWALEVDNAYEWCAVIGRPWSFKHDGTPAMDVESYEYTNRQSKKIYNKTHSHKYAWCTNRTSCLDIATQNSNQEKGNSK